MTKRTPPEGQELLELCATLLGDKHVLDMHAYDMRGRSSITDFYLVGTVRNSRQMKAAAVNLTQQLKKLGVRPLHRDGGMLSTWVVLDYLDCIVHLFTPETRQYYDIESMWQEHETALQPHGASAGTQ
ncbi:ribosome silencing factor [bacterium]|nr:ribosome silencing factor [bacterium]